MDEQFDEGVRDIECSAFLAGEKSIGLSNVFGKDEVKLRTAPSEAQALKVIRELSTDGRIGEVPLLERPNDCGRDKN